MDVRDVMTRNVYCAAPGDSLRDVAALLVEKSISGVPVCDGERHVLGVVSEGDFLYKERGPEPKHDRPRAWFAHDTTATGAAKAAALTAAEAMTSPAVTITPYRSVAAAATLMLEHGVNRLPVLKQDVLVGIVTRADLVRAFHRTDAEIADEIRKDVIGELMWLEPLAVAVVVHSGEVLLRGTIEGRLDAELLPKLAARVPGVVAVESELTWRVDDTGRRAQRAAARL
jgi:CBS domain-containing protein